MPGTDFPGGYLCSHGVRGPRVGLEICVTQARIDLSERNCVKAVVLMDMVRESVDIKKRLSDRGK